MTTILELQCDYFISNFCFVLHLLWRAGFVIFWTTWLSPWPISAYEI